MQQNAVTNWRGMPPFEDGGRVAVLLRTGRKLRPPSLPLLWRELEHLSPCPDFTTSPLRIFIDYSLPTKAPESWLGRLLGGVYARWCTKRMVDDAVSHFNST